VEVAWRWVAGAALAVEGYRHCIVAHETCSLPVDVLSPSFGTLSDYLVPHDGFLFLLEPLYFLLDPDQFLLFCSSFDFLSFLIPVLHLDLIELGVTMDDLKR
jgi:hypothetical protein